MTAKFRYAVMFMVCLAQKGDPGSLRPRKMSKVAGEQSLSEGYLERVVAALKSKGLVRATKGPGGGYVLGRSPDLIALDHVLDSIGEKVKMVRCEGDVGCLSHSGMKCNSHDLWDGMEKYMRHYLSNTSISDVANNGLKVAGEMGEYVYADYNASSEISTVVRQRVGNALLFGHFYNPSSVHKLGQGTRRIIECARQIVVEKLHATGYEVVFTSSGTEANNLVFRSGVGCAHVVSAIEHLSVMNAADNPYILPVNADGVVLLDVLDRTLSSIKDKQVIVSVMVANNETGVIQPIKEIVGIAHRHNAIVHTDAVQACGKIPVDVLDLGVDLLTISSHKIGGISGAGALLFNAKKVEILPMIRGGSQEGGLRAGTENAAAIYALSVVFEDLNRSVAKMSRVGVLRDELESRIRNVAPLCKVFGGAVDRLPNTSCVAMPGVSSEVQIMGFDNAGIAVGAGSACSLGKVGVSHVLSAMGVAEEDARSAIRISLGPGARYEHVEKIVSCWCKIYEGLK